MAQRIPVWRKPIRRRWDVRGFIRRHKNVLTIAGALIVFLTFITKDWLQRFAKDLANSLEEGQNAYFMQKQIGEMSVQLSKLNLQNEAIWRRLYGVSAAEINEAALTGRLDVDLARLSSLQMRQRAIVCGMAELKDEQRIPAAKKMLTLTVEVDGEVKEIEKVRQSGMSDADAALTKIETKIAELERATDTVSYELLDEEQEASTVYRTAYELFLEASFFLYTLGWGLALVARLYGEEKRTAE